KLVITEAKAQLKQLVAQNLALDEQTLRLFVQITLLQQQIRQLSQGLTLADLGLGPNFLDDILPEFSDLSNSLTAAKSGNWGGTLRSGSLGGQSVDAYVNSLFQSVGLAKATVDQLASSSNPATARIGTAANTGAFLSVAAESACRDAADSLKRLDTIATDIASTSTLKQALDLNTRATIELGISLAQIAVMTSVQTVRLGEMGIMDAATAAEEERYIRVLP
ncbi:MAG: type IV secretion system protein, partial [Halocynthiibacter sp.]